jgi:hypothetical protein
MMTKLRVWFAWDDEMKRWSRWGVRWGAVLAITYIWVIEPIWYAVTR